MGNPAVAAMQVRIWWPAGLSTFSTRAALSTGFCSRRAINGTVRFPRFGVWRNAKDRLALKGLGPEVPGSRKNCRFKSIDYDCGEALAPSDGFVEALQKH